MTTAAQPRSGNPNLDINDHVRKAIRTELALREMTQAELARKMDRDMMYVSRRLSTKGARRMAISLPDLQEFGEALGVNPMKWLPRLDSNQEPSGNRHEKPAATKLATVLPFPKRA